MKNIQHLVFLSLLVVSLFACGGSSNGVDEKNFIIRASSPCGEINKFMDIALKNHLTKDESQGREIYLAGLQDLVSSYEPKYPNTSGGWAFERERDEFGANFSTSVTDENWRAHLETCSDLLEVASFLKARSEPGTNPEAIERGVLQEFLAQVAPHFDNFTYYDWSENFDEVLSAPILNTHNDFGIRLDLAKEESFNRRESSVKVFAVRNGVGNIKSGDEILGAEVGTVSGGTSLDSVLDIMNESTNAPLAKLQTLFMNSEASQLTIDVKHAEGGQVERITLSGSRRAALPLVDARMMGRAAYIRLLEFDLGAAAEFREKLALLQGREKLSGVVIDLRFNPGGATQEMLKILNIFFEKNVLGVMRYRSTQLNLELNETGWLLDVPVVVLINNRTISAAEIFTQIMQESGRAVVVGEKSFGKFIGQQAHSFPLTGGTMWLTTVQYSGPMGISRQSVGNTPDLIVEDPEEKKLKEDCLRKSNSSKKCAALSIRTANPVRSGRVNYIYQGASIAPLNSISILPQAKLTIDKGRQSALLLEAQGEKNDPALKVALKLLP